MVFLPRVFSECAGLGTWARTAERSLSYPSENAVFRWSSQMREKGSKIEEYLNWLYSHTIDKPRFFRSTKKSKTLLATSTHQGQVSSLLLRL
jgi:hypothetical protein